MTLHDRTLPRAALLGAAALAAACGEIEHRFTDAPPADHDAAADAVTEIDANTGQATVRTYTLCCQAPRGRQAGVDVVVTTPAGAVRGTAVTDAQGEASVLVADGDSVTVVYVRPDGANASIRTQIGARPGDVLEFGEDYNTDFQNLGSVTYAWPAQTGIGSYLIYAGCSSASVNAQTTSTSLPHYSTCAQGGLSAIVVARDGAGVPLRHSAIASVPFAPGGTASFGAFSDAATRTLAVTLPADVEYAHAGVYALLDDFWLFGVTASDGNNPTSLAASRPSVTTPDGLAFYYNVRGRGDLGYQWGNRRLASTNSVVVTDAARLPWVTGFVASVPARRISWIETEGAPYDVRLLGLSWNAQGPVPSGKGGGESEWLLRAPPGPAGYHEVSLPALPAALERYLPREEQLVQGYVQLVDLGGADAEAVRGMPEWRVRCPDCVPLDSPAYPGAVSSSYAGTGGGKLAAPPGAAGAAHLRAIPPDALAP